MKGHNNTTGNEYADYLAKLGADLWVEGPEPFLPIPLANLKREIRGIYHQKWQKMWNNLTTCRQTKLFIPSLNPIISKEIRLLNRLDAGRIVQFFTGHIALSRHLVIMNQIDNPPTCRLCGEDNLETPHHLISSCPALEWERRSTITSEATRTRLKQTIQFFQLQRIQDLLNFQEQDT